jgi:hypothetical protein
MMFLLYPPALVSGLHKSLHKKSGEAGDVGLRRKFICWGCFAGHLMEISWPSYASNDHP